MHPLWVCKYAKTCGGREYIIEFWSMQDDRVSDEREEEDIGC